jgi:hypothetical protein
VEVYQQQIEMEKLNHQGELMLKKATDETDRDIIREPLTELKHLWENLGEKIAHRQVRQMAERVTWTTVYCYLIS